MRQLLIQVPPGNGKKVLELAKKHGGANLSQFEATGSDGAIGLAIVHVSNGKVEVTLAVTIVALIGLLSWQLTNPPNLQRSTRAQRATAEVQQVVEARGIAQLVEANIRFTRPNLQGQNTLLGVVYVQRQSGVNASSEEIRTSLTRKIQTRLLEQGFNATPLIDVSVLEAPNSK
jgi:hypothetical protein